MSGPASTDTTPAASEAYARLVSTNKRHINSLSDSERGTRKRGLSAIKDVVKKISHDKETLGNFFLEHLAEPLLALFSDPVEKCREVSLDIYTRVIEAGCMDENDALFSKIATDAFCAVRQRVGVATIVEPSEEIRLGLIELVHVFVKHRKASAFAAAILGDIVHILVRGLADKFPDCKRTSAKCVISLTNIVPRDIHLHFKSLLGALVLNMGHQRSKVRQVTLQAAGALARCGGEGLDRAMKEHLIPMIARASEDRTAAVRKESVTVVSSWFECLPGNEAYEHVLLPVLLSAVADPAIDIARFALTQLEATGKIIASNDSSSDALEDMKDNVNILDHLPEPFETRAGHPVRILVSRVMPRMLPTVLEEVRAWTLAARLRASKILRTMLVCAESSASAHLPEILDALCAMFTDDEADVRAVALDCARVLGACVPPSESLPILFTRAKGEAQGLGSAEHQAGALFVISSLVTAFDANAIVDNAHKVANVLADPRVRASEAAVVRIQAVEVADAVLESMENFHGEDGDPVAGDILRANPAVARDLLIALLQIGGSPAHEDADGVIPQLLRAMARLADPAGNADAMFQMHAQSLLDACLGKDGDCSTWTVASPSTQLFDQIVRTVGVHNIAVAGQLDAVVETFVKTLQPTIDPEVRMAMLALLETALSDGARSVEFHNAIQNSIPRLCMDVVRPNLVWRAGRVAATIRKVSVFCLRALLGELDASLGASWIISTFLPGFLAPLKSCLEDNDADTRRFSCSVLDVSFKLSPKSLEYDTIIDVYADLVKRLDDSNDDVRIAACDMLLAFVRAGASGALRSTALDYTLDALLVHLDDSDANVQQKVLAVLDAMLRFDSKKVAAKATAARNTHRTPELCDQLVKRAGEV